MLLPDDDEDAVGSAIFITRACVAGLSSGASMLLSAPGFAMSASEWSTGSGMIRSKVYVREMITSEKVLCTSYDSEIDTHSSTLDFRG
jgi:hypothetical protein